MGKYFYLTVIVLLAVALVLLILIPLVSLAFDSTFIQSTNSAKRFHLTEILKNSNLLFVTHCSCLSSTTYATIDILLDFDSKNSRVNTSLRLRERCVYLISLFVPVIVYLSFRTMNCIADLYYAVSYAMTIITVAATYSAVYPELLSKMDSWFLFGVTAASGLLMVFLMLQAYAMLLDLDALLPVNGVLLILSAVTANTAIFRWIYLVRSRRNFEALEVKLLSLEEFNFLMYWVPSVVLAPIPLLGKAFTGELSWKNQTADSIVVVMVVRFLVGAVILIVPGRVVRMMAEIQPYGGGHETTMINLSSPAEDVELAAALPIIDLD